MQSLNFDKFQKIDISVKWAPLCVKKRLTLSAVGNVASRISQTTSKASELWRIMSSNQRKGDVKLATLQKLLVQVVAGALNIFTEVRKEKFEIQTIAQMAGNITAIVWKVS